MIWLLRDPVNCAHPALEIRVIQVSRRVCLVAPVPFVLSGLSKIKGDPKVLVLDIKILFSPFFTNQKILKLGYIIARN